MRSKEVAAISDRITSAVKLSEIAIKYLFGKKRSPPNPPKSPKNSILLCKRVKKYALTPIARLARIAYALPGSEENATYSGLISRAIYKNAVAQRAYHCPSRISRRESSGIRARTLSKTPTASAAASANTVFLIWRKSGFKLF